MSEGVLARVFRHNAQRVLAAVGYDMNAGLFRAAAGGQTVKARILVAAGADVSADNGENWTVLHEASWSGSTKIAAILLEHGADLWREDSARRTAEDLAFVSGHAMTGMLLHRAALARCREGLARMAL